MKESFVKEILERYTTKGDYITLGKAKLDKEVVPEAEIKIALKTLNRHGLIAGATGTGKTKTLQIIAEQLALKGVPSLVMDLKGDLSGLAQAGETNKHISERHAALQIPYKAEASEVEVLTLSEQDGVRLRATVSEFGPMLLSKILDLNETQESIISIIFKYADDKLLPLVDLDDLKKTLQYVTESEEGKQELKENYGSISGRSLGAILRKIVALEQQGADIFFGEPSFEVNDLLQSRGGKGVVNIIRLTDIQNKPQLFSTFMLSLLAEIYETFPEQGDADKPKLMLFIDEAHLIFNEASKALLNQIETMVKLIRSKGVGLIFITQVPGDVPEEVLSQLGLKVQHALRGFTAKDRKEIKKAVENYPITDFYNADQLITELGIGEAFVTGLNEKGIPTPLAHTYLRAPLSRMDILTDVELKELINSSDLVKKYALDVDKESAYEILNKKMERAEIKAEDNAKVEQSARRSRSTGRSRQTQEKTFAEQLSKNTMVRQMGRTIVRELMRGLMGALKK